MRNIFFSLFLKKYISIYLCFSMRNRYDIRLLKMHFHKYNRRQNETLDKGVESLHV